MTDHEAARIAAAGGLSRAEMRRLAKDLLQKLRPLNDEVARKVEEAQEAVSGAAASNRNLKIQARLRTTTLEQLAKNQRIRGAGLNNLRHRGIETAADIERHSIEDLAATPDLGPESARRLKERATQLRNVRLDDLRLPAAPDFWQGADETLARALIFWHKIASLAGSATAAVLGELLTEFLGIIRQTARRRWYFSSRETREGIKQKIHALEPRVRALIHSGDFEKLGTRLRDLRHHQGVPVDRSYWKSNSAELMSELEEFQTQLGDEATRTTLAYSLGRTSGLASDLTERMHRLNLDLSLVSRRLRKYQEQGTRFAICVKGGLLGDDMGLGKTSQALAAIAHCTAAEGTLHHVVVCPASLIATWEEEARAVLSGIKVWRFHGQATRQHQLEQWEREGGILLTSYHLKPLRLALKRRFGFLVVDEAHSFKDPSIARTKLVKQLAQRAERVLLMTGTPLVNKAMDMINLLAIVDQNIAAGLEHRFGRADDILHQADAFRHALSAHYLRRSRADVLGELPPLTLSDVPIELSPEEIVSYKQAVTRGHMATMRIMASISRGPSSKMATLEEIVSETRESEQKMLIFSEFIGVLEAATKTVGSDYAYLVRGGISNSETERREAEFSARPGFAALVCQIRKGGLGKNFQAASVIVLMEPQFTPAAEFQAISRAHRMGQTKPVVCHRLVALGTVDERLVELVSLKSELVNELANESDLATALSNYRGRSITEAQLVADERRRLGIPAPGHNEG